MKNRRPSLLYLCPIMPQRSGNGLAMRAAMVLEGLARRFDVHLFVIPVSGGSIDVPAFVRTLTTKVAVGDLATLMDPLAMLIATIADPAERDRRRAAYPLPWAARFSGLAAAKEALVFMGETSPDMIHIMRLHLAPIADHILRLLGNARPVAMLDLDDDDARVCERTAALRSQRGEDRQAANDRAEADKYTTTAARLLAKFDLVLTASTEDADRLSTVFADVRFATLPNGYAPPEDLSDRSPRDVSTPLRLLFLANLGYYPNEDAAYVLIEEVMPALRGHGRSARLDIVGPGAPKALADRAGADVVVHGAVDNVAACYEQADMAVIPLRAGGGSRIKILEAFAHRVPVISTSIGAEGLQLVSGEHFLCADTADEMAMACVRLADDPRLRARLAANAHALLELRHTSEKVHGRLDAILDHLIFEGANDA